MATVTVRRSDLFPVGVTVGIYPAGANAESGPGAPAIASAAVDAAGLLTVTDAGIASLRTYVAAAQINGVWRYARCRSTLDIHEPGTVVGTGDTESGSATILNASASAGSFQIGQRISGPGIRSGTLINNIVSTTLTLDQTCSATATTVAIAGEGGLSWRSRLKRRKAAIGTT